MLFLGLFFVSCSCLFSAAAAVAAAAAAAAAAAQKETIRKERRRWCCCSCFLKKIVKIPPSLGPIQEEKKKNYSIFLLGFLSSCL